MSNEQPGLDIDIIKSDEQWEVWTPGFWNGAIIGIGRTKKLAKEAAVRNMKACIDFLQGATK